MPITSNNSNPIFWAMYPTRDNMYLSPYKSGTLKNGDTQNLQHPEGQYKLEIKLKDRFGAFLLTAGKIYMNDDAIVVNQTTVDVNVVTPPEVPEKPNEEKPKEEKPKKKGRLKKFFDFIFDRD